MVAGSAGLSLAANVVHLDPKPAVFEAMLAGWTDQQKARFLRVETIKQRIAMIRRFTDFSGQYPWEWLPSEADAYFAQLNSGPTPAAVSTARGYQIALRMFCDYLVDQRYGWGAVCAERFGATPVQILHAWNTVVHVSEFEGRAGRRALSYDEVQLLFDAADEEAERIRRIGHKGALRAVRDAALLKLVYAFGLRRCEVVGLDLTDLRVNPKVGSFGRCGALFVRHGKASRGGPPKRRTVLTVPEMDWVVGVLDHYLDEVGVPVVTAQKTTKFA
ncbi:site-specific integrase [Rhodococcus sp. WAY2]|uniref:site-specific integrase n=1 Tax=Rhodococcus sp. WAY2 TaxID=2663121 RepID=UPI0013204521|nr:site-specific integrase [Rhodococcus sp. WAY2]QHE73114.1 putative integrase/recombinase [Rhodococcus sp. WAY2]